MTKLCLLLLTCSVLTLHAGISYSQQVKLNLEMKNVSLSDVIYAIKQQTEFEFAYDSNLESLIVKEISINAQNEKIDNVLASILQGTEINYRVIDKIILLSKNTVRITSGLEDRLALQQQKVTGIVTDATTGEPITGANIIVEGTTFGTISDAEGKFSIDVPSPNAILLFSFVGYNSEKIEVNNRTSVSVMLIPDIRSLEEVIVVGYGSMKKSDLTGSVSSIKTGDIQQTPMTSIDQGLVGRASGVQVTQTSGMPGAVASIRVRGSSSIQGGNEPLYVIDGFPVYNGSGFGDTGGKVQMSGLSTVNPSDIESIEILKDAAATAIYGARAANGVVLITTKTGKKGRNTITLEASYGIQNVSKKIDVMDAQNYAELVNEAYTNDKLTAPYDAARLAEIATLGKGTDWQDEIFRSGVTQNYQLTFSGGDDKTTYAISGNYLDQKGIIINSNFKRYSTRLNLERNLNEIFKVGTHISVSHTINDAVPTDVGGEDGVITGALKMNPILPVYSNVATGAYTQVNTPGTLEPNPVATAKEQLYNNITTRLLGDVFSEWKIIDGLKAKVSFGADLFYNNGNTYTPSTIYQSNGKATAKVSFNRSVNWLNENTLSWVKSFNDIHTVNALAGFTMQQNDTKYVLASASDFVSDITEYNNLDAGALYNQPNSYAEKWSLMSYLARVNYTLNGRYLFSVNSRIDGSSRFGEDNKYGFFPSGSLGWRVSEESFMTPLSNAISNLKLRASYGFTGNTEIGVYESLATMGNNSWMIGNQLVSGFYPNRIANPDLKWERTSQVDIGADLGLVDNRIRITTDYYKKITTDLLYNVSIPSASGYSTMLKNVGSVENQGVEISIESDNLSGNFQWTTSFNISFNKNKVIELGGETYKEMAEGDGHLKTGSIRRLIVGEPLGIFYGYRFDGIFQNEEETKAQLSSTSPIGIGLRRYKDLNGDKKVDATNDREILGDANPDFFGGLTNTFIYKGVELNVFVQYCYGNEIFNYNAIELETPTGGQNNYAELVNRWTPTNPSNIYPKANTNRAVLSSDRWVEDGSYIKLKTISLSYNFNNFKFKHIQGLKLFLTGQNLLTLTDYRGYDPEVSYRGASTLEAGEDYGGYPQSKTFMVGVRIDMK